MSQRLASDAVLCLALVSGSIGCGKSNHASDLPDAMAPPDGGDGGDVVLRGTAVGHFVTDRGVVDSPSDLMDAMAPRADVGLTPVVTWDPPAIGAPTGYNVQVEDVTADASNQTVLDDVADVTTTSTTLAIPPSILVSGHSYLLVISADLLPGADVVAAPLLATGVAPHHHARLATAQFTP